MGERVKEASRRRYYRLALFHAEKQELTTAIQYARFAMLIDSENREAARLLGLCLYELGELKESAELFYDDNGLADIVRNEYETTQKSMEEIGVLIKSGKWRNADKKAESIRQSVRVLNIRGCIYASVGKYIKATDFFTEALERDRGNSLAFECLADCMKHKRNVLFGILNKF